MASGVFADALGCSESAFLLVPAVRGNAAAQELDARLTAGETPLGRLGVVAFWTPARRDLVMQLPTV